MDKIKINNKISLLLLIIFSVITYYLVVFLRIHNLVPGADYGADVYYHIKAGDMFPFIATTKIFPWTELSIWKTHFYDKELGFHFIIYILRNIAGLFGFSSAAPFNFVSFCFSGFMILFVSIWAYLKNRRLAFVIVPLFVFISPMFMQKLTIIRPALLSITLFFLTLFVLLSNKSFKFKIITIFILGWIYSLSYSVPHIILMPLGIFFISRLFTKNYKSELKYLLLPIAGLLGVFVGLTLHPQFPNTYINWYIQGYQVVLKMFGISHYQVGLGDEMYAPNAFLLKMNAVVFILAFINIVLFCCSKEKSKNKIFLLIIQTFTVIGFCFTNRFIEYAVPATVVTFAIFTAQTAEVSESNPIIRFFSSKITGAVAAIILIFFMIPYNNTIMSRLYFLPPPYKFAKWAQTNLPENTYVGLLNWGDFPCLFYADQDLKYSMALDPMFSYYDYPKRTATIEKFRLGIDKSITPQELSNALGTDLVYARKLYKVPVFDLMDKGAYPLYFDDVGCLLKLPPPEKNYLIK